MIGLLGRVGQNGVVEREMENQDGKKKKKRKEKGLHEGGHAVQRMHTAQNSGNHGVGA